MPERIPESSHWQKNWERMLQQPEKDLEHKLEEIELLNINEM